MAPIWYIILVLLLLVFAIPLLLKVSAVITDGLQQGLEEVGPGVLAVALLAMLLITVVGLVKIIKRHGG